MSSTRIYDPEIAKVSSFFPILNVANAEESRAMINAMRAKAIEGGVVRPSDDNVEERELTIPGKDGAPDIPIRIYMPRVRPSAGPAFVNFHGGGFIMGDLESEHAKCLQMAAHAGCVSIGVDYRLAPEHPFPAGLEDCYQALVWANEHAAELGVDPSRIAIGGSSAGGNLTACVALMSRDKGGPQAALQMLFYPVIDDLCKTESMINGGDCHIWNTQNSLDMWDQYLGKDRQEISPYAAPSRATNLEGLPAAYVITCEHDPLRDEAILYAMRLMDAGVPVELCNYPGTVHGFDGLIPSQVSARAVGDAIGALTRAIG
jgi:acetyl esterase/lipase